MGKLINQCPQCYAWYPDGTNQCPLDGAQLTLGGRPHPLRHLSHWFKNHLGSPPIVKDIIRDLDTSRRPHP